MNSGSHGLLRQASSRREFLKTSLAGGAILSAAGFLAQCTSPETPGRPDLVFLNAREFETLTAFARAILPALVPGAVDATPYRIDREVARWNARSQSQVKQVLALVENGTRYFLFSIRPFRELATRDAQDYLRAWETSRFDFRRTAYQALRMLTLFYYYSQDAAWPSIGYDGPWVKPEAATP